MKYTAVCKSRYSCLARITILTLLVLIPNFAFAQANSSEDDLGSAKLRFQSQPKDPAPQWKQIQTELKKPEDIEVLFLGDDNKSDPVEFYQLRYGDPGSTRICLAIVSKPNREFELFADLNRDRQLVESELISGMGKERVFEAEAIISENGKSSSYQRTIRFRRGIRKGTHLICTAGEMAGEVQIGTETHQLKLVDANANGLFADAEDRLWIDLNQDREWQAASEQMTITPFLEMNDHRVSLYLPLSGEAIQFEDASQTGTVQLQFRFASAECEVDRVSVMLTDERNNAFRISSLNPFELPVGRYRVRSVVMSVVDEKSNKWGFDFGYAGIPNKYCEVEIREDENATLDPIEQVELKFIDFKTSSEYSSLQIRPQLYTDTGLYLLYSGSDVFSRDNVSDSAHNLAKVEAFDSNGKNIGRQTSGFR